MKNNETENEIRSGKLAANLIAGGYTVLCGIFLLLVGLKVFGESLSMRNMALPTILLTVGLVFLTTAFVQWNSVSMWLAFVFVVPAAVSYINNFTAASYAQLYPLYIAIPAIASFFTMFMSCSKRDHLYIIGFFGLIALIFAIQSSGLAGWGVTLPVLVVFVGLTIVLAAIKLNMRRTDEDDE